MTTALKHGELTDRIIRVFYDVYNELGNGFLERFCEGSMTIALRQDGMDALRQVPPPVWFRGQKVGDFRADLLAANSMLIEIKCARAIEPVHEAQVLHYLKSTEIEVGLLLNFGPSPQIRRFIFSNERRKIRVNPRKSAVRASA